MSLQTVNNEQLLHEEHLSPEQGELFGACPWRKRVTHGRNVTACRREMLRNVYPAEFQIHLRNTNLWNTVTK